MGYVFRRPWPTWRRKWHTYPFILPPTPPVPPVVTPTARDRRGVLITTLDPSQVSDPSPALAYKKAVKYATTASITLRGNQTIDGNTTVDGDRILVKDQSDATLNGIYSASSGWWRRTLDADGSNDFAPGTKVFVISGSLNVHKIYTLSTANPFVLGTSSLNWFAARNSKAIEFSIDGGGSVIVPATEYTLEVDDSYTILAWRILADRVGSIQFDIYKNSYSGFYAASSICGASFPSLSSERKNVGTDLSLWTATLVQGDLLTAVVSSVSSIQFCTLSLLLSRN